jgi:hypothetical protein
MADIDVVPKRRSYTWLWVLLAVIVIAALIWAFAGGPTNRVTKVLQHAPNIASVSVIRSAG